MIKYQTYSLFDTLESVGCICPTGESRQKLDCLRNVVLNFISLSTFWDSLYRESSY